MTHPVRRGVFITGTDTGVGKTVITAALIRALVRQGLCVAGMKPVAAGASSTPSGLRNADALALLQAANVAAPYATVNPYCFAAPIAPHIAARDARVAIDIELIRRRFDELSKDADCVVVEGAGGWLTPISERASMADVATALALPAVLVVALRLGCLNHACLTARALAAHGAGFAGWIGNSIDPAFERAADNIAELERHLQPAAAIVPYASHEPEALELQPAAALNLVARAASSVT
jgi:dethiobiotin synthetase